MQVPIESNRRDLVLMLLIVVATGLYNLIWAEKITWNNGFGADGHMYGSIVKYLDKGISRFSGARTAPDNAPDNSAKKPDLPNRSNSISDRAVSASAFQRLLAIFSGKLDSYYLQRIVPSAVVFCGLKLLRIPVEDGHIIKGFELLNTILLLAAAWLWMLISRELNLGSSGRWLGFAGLFLNFFNLKFNTYYPVLTDVAAFTLGLGMLYLFLVRGNLRLLGVGVIGFFTWPTALYTSLLLFIFPRSAGPSQVESGKNPYSKWISLALGSIAVSMAVFVHYIQGYQHNDGTIESWIPLSMCGLFLYVFFATRGISDTRNILGFERDGGLLLRVLVAITLVLLLKRLSFQLSNADDLTAHLGYVQAILALSVAKPLIFGLAHVVYFGPIALLTYFLWGSIGRNIGAYGPGLILVTCAAVFQSLGSESRQLSLALPFIVAFTAKAAEGLEWRRSYFWFFILLSLLYSKIWLRINFPEPVIFDPGAFFGFPAQRLFMNIGYWMSTSMYLVQGGVVAITGVLFYFMLFRSREPAAHIRQA